MRLIKAEDVKELINGLDSLPWEEEVDDLVNSLPTVEAEPVVHCDECVYFKQGYPNELNADGLCECIDKLMDYDDFCSCGLRKDDGVIDDNRKDD